MSDPIPTALVKDWDALVSVLPDDLEVSAKTYGALRRRRGITTAASLLRLILIYATVLSLRLVAVWGVGLKLCDISRQAIQKRVQQSTPWLRYLMTALLRTLLELPSQETGGEPINRVILRDASVIARPGSPGTEWRLHLSWSPFDHQPAQRHRPRRSRQANLDTLCAGAVAASDVRSALLLGESVMVPHRT